MTKYRELKIWIDDLKDGVGKLPAEEVEEERARLNADIQKAQEAGEINGTQAYLLQKALP